MFKQILFWFGLCFVLVGCDNRTEYLKHDLELEKIGPCIAHNESISIEANTIGERFVFEHCLDDNNSGQSLIERRKDTVIVKFANAKNPNTLYKVTLDINTQPEYHFLSIDGNVVSINIKR